ncbi:ATP-binding protein [Aestuariispira insulae]|uniref:histidine kinase n=1 Tax=Aestuariispira insulae TaxID=1461337 RepID=A0A3D9HP80_9PROT|nr:ATP-binding protein [Aestuariispira insulae]RED51303.1 signal transduction histidine kinase [Aestuariispira insulae]
MTGQISTLDLVLENIIQGVVMFDAAQNLEVWNRQYQQILQFPDGFLKPGLSNYEMALYLAKKGTFGPGDPDLLARERVELIWTPGEVRTNITIAGDRAYEVLCKRTETGGLVVTYTDMTERERALADLAELNQQKDRFMTVVAHDLKTPFNALLGCTDVLDKNWGQFSKTHIRDYISIIRQASLEAYKLLEDMLEWSRLQLGGYQADISPLDLDDLILTNLARYDPLARLKNIRIDSQLEDGLEVLADINMLDTVLRNLISNAIKFSPDHTVITLSATQMDSRIKLSIRDQGQGIAPEQQARLFQFQPGLSTKGTHGEAGTGLGLHLCQELMEQMSGQITFVSEPGQGSTFHVNLPAAAD